MSSQTFKDFSKFAGSRVATNPDLEVACEVIDDLPCRDLLTMLTLTSHVRALEVEPADIIDGNRFHESSPVPQRSSHKLDGVIMDELSEVDFVELSPLQPFGLNTALAGTNVKNIVPALRRSEVNADATTSLLRVAVLGLKDQSSYRVATNVRVTRAQQFDPKTKFLPHFKVFAQVTVGEKSDEYGGREVESLLEHLDSEIGVFSTLQGHEDFDVQNVDIAIGNLVFTKDLIERGLLDRDELRANTTNPDYNALEAAGLDLPDSLPLDTPDLQTTLKDLGFTKGARLTSDFQQTAERLFPDLLPKIHLHLGRIAGLGYYQHMCYKIEAENSRGIRLPLADGGTVNWASKAVKGKKLFTTATGIGTELLAQHFQA